MPESAAELVLLAGVFALAGFVKGVIGMGLPTVSISLLSLMMPPAQAVALTLAPSFVTNIWQSVAGPNLRRLLLRLGPMLAATCIGIWAGSGLLLGEASSHARLALGLCLVVYSAIGLAAVRFVAPPRHEPWLSPAIGAVTGLVTGATGIFVVPAVPYLQAMQISRDELVQALGLSFVVSTIALAGVLLWGGVLHTGVGGLSALAVAPALCGMALGQRIRARIRPPLFRTCFFFGMLALGAHLSLRALQQ